MPRFHFNVYDGRTTIDQVGTDLDNLNEAKLEAIWLAGQMISETSSISVHVRSGVLRSRMIKAS